MNPSSPFQQLPIVARMPGGFCWYLADPCWQNCAWRANRQILCSQQEQADVEVLKKGRRRLVYRLKRAETDCGKKSIVIKSFPLSSLKNRLFRHGRYGRAETWNLLEAEKRGLPVPKVFGYGKVNRWPLVLNTMVMMEDLAPRHLLAELLEEKQTQLEQQAELLDRTLKLFLQLYQSGCNHIDLNSQSIWLAENPRDGEKISDFQYTRFLDKPSVRTILCQAAYFTRSCSALVPTEVLESWTEKLFLAIDIKKSGYWLKIYNCFLNRDLSRAQRLSAR